MNVLVACSNPVRIKDEYFLGSLGKMLEGEIIISAYLSSEDAKAKADELNHYFEIDAPNIFDISGGDLANGVLPYLDFQIIANSASVFHGYSDLTTVINAIYSQTNKRSWYYQVRFSGYYPEILERVMDNTGSLDVEFVQGREMDGIAIGGNIRCFLKLAGTRYLPNFTGHILFLEAYSTEKYQLMTMISQLEQMGAFERIAGLVLGTFTRIEQVEGYGWLVGEFKKHCDKPIAITRDFGHHQSSKGFLVGGHYKFDRNSFRD